jgi:hypothetical protein
MRRPGEPDSLERFLEAERADRTEESEEALFALFEALPELAPPAGFGERTLARLGVATVRPTRAALWRRGFFLLGIAAVAWMAAWTPAILAALGHLVSPVGLVNAANGAVTSILLAGSELLGMAQKLFVLGEVLARPLRTPQVSTAAAVCLVLSGMAFRSLRDLLSRQRSWAHVEPI